MKKAATPGSRAENEATEPRCLSSMEELGSALQASGINLGRWGNGDADTLEKLWQEYSLREIELEFTPRSVIRHQRGAGIEVTYQESQGQILKLLETRHVMRDGRVVLQNEFPGSVGEKLLPGEDEQLGAERCLREGLGLTGHPTSSHKFRRDVPSRRYPGLQDITQTYFFAYRMPDDQYEPNGYQEEQEDKTVVFAWRPVTRAQLKARVRLHA